MPGLPRPSAKKSYLACLSSSWLWLLLLAAIGVVIHTPALSGQFIWDDDYLARDNPFIKSPLFVFECFRHYLFLDSLSVHYRPVQNISYMLDYWLWDNNAFGFHLTNVLLHVGSGLLLYFLVRRLLSFHRARALVVGKNLCWPGYLVALIWTVHPVHSAAVDYISGRADSLAFLFASGGWLLFLKGQEQRERYLKIILYSLGTILGLLALCSRESALIWLAIFLLDNLFFHPRLTRGTRLGVSIVCASLVITYSGLRHLPAARAGAAGPSEWPLPTKVSLMFRALGDYGRLMVVPFNLHMERSVVDPANYRSTLTWQNSGTVEYLSILGLLCAGILVAGCSWRAGGRSLRIFGTLWFVVAFLPISNLVDLNATVAEHWLYLPSVGLLIFLLGCVEPLSLTGRKAALAATCCAIAAFGVRSAIRSSDWFSPEIFYQRTIAAGGGSTRVMLNWARLLAERGDFRQAENVLRKILQTTPDNALARSNLGDVLIRAGRKDEAAAIFATGVNQAAKERVEIPRTWLAALNLATIRHNEHDDAKALRILEDARKDYPDVWEIVSRESELLRESQGPKSALVLVSNFARDHWWHYGAALALGRLYAQAGDVARATDQLQQASRLDIREVEALNILSEIQIRQNRLEEAYRLQKRAVARQPAAPRQYALLCDILGRMGNKSKAKEAENELSRLQALGSNAFAAAN